MVARLAVPRSEINSRLKKIEGQLRGIQGMVDSERDCVDIMVQLTAAKAGLESVAALVFRNYTVICLDKNKCDNDIGLELAHIVSLWVGGRAKSVPK